MDIAVARSRRALMYVPGNEERKIARGAGSGADGIILDIEDGVAFNKKDEAREIIQHSLRQVDFGISERWVRINALNTGRAEADLQMVLPGQPDGILIPKVDSVETVQVIDDEIARLEESLGIEKGKTALALTIESAKAFIHLSTICKASPRIQVLVFGAEDFTADTGITRTQEASELLFARSTLVMNAAAFGYQAIDMVHTNFTNLEQLETECRKGAELGFSGKQVIHPAQIQIVQEAFSPSARAIEHARGVIENARAAQIDGKGAFSLDGQMIDLPVVKRAESIIARAKAAGLLD